MHDRTDTGVEKNLQAVREGEESIGCGNRTASTLMTFSAECIGAFNREFARIYTVNLPHADPHGGTVIGEHNRIGLGSAQGTPREFKVTQSGFVGRFTGDQLPILRVITLGVKTVGFLEERTARNRTVLDSLTPEPVGKHQQAQIFLGFQDFEGFRLVSGCHNNLGENIFNGLRHILGDRAVRGNHATIGGQRIASMSLSVRIGNRVCGVRACNCNTAGVVVLDDGDRRLIKIVGGTQGGIGVHIVVVAHRLAVNLLSLGDTGGCCGIHIQSRALMRILAVTQGLAAFKAQTSVRGPEVSVFILLELRGGPGSDGGIVSGGMGKGAGGQAAALL